MCAAYRLKGFADERGADDAETAMLQTDAGVQGRYTFLVGASAFEAGANALLRSLNTSNSLYKDLEKLPTLLKYEMFCLAMGHELPRGNHLYKRVVDVVRARNTFVHPKPKTWNETAIGNAQYNDKRSTTGYPSTFSALEPQHARQTVADILAFISWVLFDICGLSIEQGCERIGLGSLVWVADVAFAAKEFDLDIRSFGENAMLTAEPGLAPDG